MDTFGLSSYLQSVGEAESERALVAQEQLAATAKSDNDYQQELNRKSAEENQERTELQGLLDISAVELGKEGIKNLRSAGSKLLRNKLKEFGLDAESLKDKGYSQLKKMLKDVKAKAQSKIDSIKSKVQNQVEDAKSKLEDKADDLRTKVSDVQDEIGSKIDDVKSTADGKINDVTSSLDDIQEQAQNLNDIPPEIDSTALPENLTRPSIKTGLEGDIPLDSVPEPLDFNDMDENLSRRLVNLVNKDKLTEPLSSLDAEFNAPTDILNRPIGKSAMKGVSDPTEISEDTQKFLSGYSDDSISFMNRMALEDKIRGRVFKGGKTLPQEDNSDILGDDGEKLFNRMNQGDNLEGILKPEEESQLQSLRGTIKRKILSKLKTPQPEEEIEMQDMSSIRPREEPEIPDRMDTPDEPSRPDIRADIPDKPLEQETSFTKPEDVGEGEEGQVLKKGTEAEVEKDISDEAGEAAEAADVGAEAGEAAGEGAALAEGAETAGEIELAGGGPEDPIADIGAGVALVGSAIGGLFAPKPKEKTPPPPPPPIVKQLILNPSQEFGV